MGAKDTSRSQRLLPGGIPRWIRCYDSGPDSSADRYTVVFTGRYRHKTGGEFWYVVMSTDPFHPQGIGAHVGSLQQIDAPHGAWPPAMGRTCHLGQRIPFSGLPAACQRLVLQDYRNLWDLPKGLFDPSEPDEGVRAAMPLNPMAGPAFGSR